MSTANTLHLARDVIAEGELPRLVTWNGESLIIHWQQEDHVATIELDRDGVLFGVARGPDNEIAEYGVVA